MLTYYERLRQKILAQLKPMSLEIIDDSARHSGHSGADDAGETHFIITVVSEAFDGLPRLARHRLIYAAVADEINEHVHALALKTYTPQEFSALNATDTKMV